MHFQPQHYYHLYNRTNNNELLFKENENYRYFLKKFHKRFDGLLTVYAYCLMPTHFHFLVKTATREIELLPQQIGIHLSGYTKAINKRYDRHGSLFQRHTKAKHITKTKYLIKLITYIHQNPVRARLVKRLEDWPFSSYRSLANDGNDTLVDKSLVYNYFKSKEAFVEFSELTIAIPNID